MIVAEEDGIRDLLSQVFITKGAKVTRPASLSKALRPVQKGKVDLVVVDLEGMSSHGIKWIEEITRIDPGLPVACIPSQRGGLGDEKALLELSNNLILIKRPIETNSLLQVVSEKIANYRFKKTP
jgi:DNA-binding NtrC family response regulator